MLFNLLSISKVTPSVLIIDKCSRMGLVKLTGVINYFGVSNIKSLTKLENWACDRVIIANSSKKFLYIFLISNRIYYIPVLNIYRYIVVWIKILNFMEFIP